MKRMSSHAARAALAERAEVASSHPLPSAEASLGCSERSIGSERSHGSVTSQRSRLFRKRSRQGDFNAEPTSASRVPAAVHDRLQEFRTKYKRNDSNAVSLSNLLSLQAVQRELHVPPLLVKESSQNRQPGRSSKQLGRVGASAAIPEASGGTVAGAAGSALHTAVGALGSLLRASGSYDDPLEGAPNSAHALTYVHPEVNKRIRTQLLRQHWFTTRFHGSREAEYAEAGFKVSTSRYELRRVGRRLLVTALLLTFSAIEPFYTDVDRAELTAYLVLHTGMPVFLLLVAAVLCVWIRTRGAWRLIVVVAWTAAYSSLLWVCASVTPR